MGTPLKVLVYIYIYTYPYHIYIYIYLQLYIQCILYIHDPVGIVILYVKEVDSVSHGVRSCCRRIS